MRTWLKRAPPRFRHRFHGATLDATPAGTAGSGEAEAEGEGEGPEEEEDAHGCDGARCERNRIFARWILDHFRAQCVGSSCAVLDVAGGRGELSAELHKLTGGTPCTVVDPQEDYRDGAGGGGDDAAAAPHRSNPVGGHRRRAAQSLAPGAVIRERFDGSFAEKHADVCDACSLVVAMHPDEATEAAVDAALALRKPFAVVPCCVYKQLFPERRRSNGLAVKKYSTFLEYLQRKDPRIQSARLPFVGRNRVLFMRPDPETSSAEPDEAAVRCLECPAPAGRDERALTPDVHADVARM